MGEGVLEDVEALREVRSELEVKKQQLNTTLLEELSKNLYYDSTRETSLQRHGSNKDFQRGIEARNSKGNKIKKSFLDVTVSFPGGTNIRLFFNVLK